MGKLIMVTQGMTNNTLASSLLDSKCESKMKPAEEQGVRARSLARSTLGVEGRVGAPRWD